MVVVMAAAGLYVFNRAVGGGEPVVVPNVVELPVAQAQMRLAEVGLVMGTMRPMESDRVPENHVIAQRPEAGRVVRAGRRVTPTVSQGAVQAVAPDLVGRTIGEAADVLASMNIEETPGARIRHRAARGTIIAQDPPAGQPVSGHAIRFLVSEGPTDTFLMPEIVGMQLGRAEREFRRLGITGRAIIVNEFEAALDEVLEQLTPPGSVIAPGQVVLYKVRPTNPAELENALHEVRARYTVPHRYFPSRVRAEGVLKDGTRMSTPLLQEKEYESGSTISFPFRYTDTATIEFFVDGVLHQSYYYQGSADPVVTTHREPEGNENA